MYNNPVKFNSLFPLLIIHFFPSCDLFIVPLKFNVSNILTHTILVMNSESFDKLSTTEIKELLYQRNIDSAGIYDRHILLGLLLGKNQETDYRATLPQSYLKLFEVCDS